MKRTLSNVEYEDGEKQSIIKSSELFSTYEFDDQDITLVYDDDDDTVTNSINKKQNIEKISSEKKQLPYFLQLLMNNSKYLDNIPSTINNNNNNIKCFYCEIILNNNNNEVNKCVKCDRYTCHLKSGCSMLDKYNTLYCLECIQNQY
ncbi:hypothetical protein HANVADRAFT_47896 [Hanseniaspora valbyensis NRRL Y-1626]|uniref:Uncharacterized protein n=1 Tax=Hanseniaspora valbyensis NRRL Y-1626 TaxID=766949 RepID=A0A1B7TGY5_9ASCO|nr:hypothetical protein HANVADRAFT_47896 [Hanseniaspora valbyensis NRRL Y-1626]